ncbi:MAG: type II toxin-antitoxin system YoeB family toxin [Treponemataceae bacterium]|nr:type II toxin-antitoxin system YoeB family toxin [Treponemataceae bacterium]
MSKILFADEGWEDYLYWQTEDKKTLQKINKLLKSIERKENKEIELGDKTHHLIFNAAAYDKEKDPELKDFLSFVKNNTAQSDFTRGIANMVQTKKFEQTFINEYLAWNLHDQDVENRGKKAGKMEAYFDLIKSGLLSITDAAKKLGVSEAELKAQL